MRITRLRTQIVHLPFAPIVSGLGTVSSTSCVLCFLETDQPGLVGEALVHAIGGRRIGVLDEIVRSLEPLVSGLRLDRGGSLNVRAWQEFNFLGAEGLTIQALSAVDGALWDLRGKAAGLNLAALIGACRDSVPVYASGGLWLGATIDELQREASDFVSRGFRAMKTRLGPGDPHAMVQRVRAIREAVGPGVALMADANQQLGVKEAIRLGRMLGDYDLAWFEEPVACHDHDGEAAVTAALTMSVASGESVHTHRGVFRMLQARAADVVMPDLQRMGGPTEFLKAAHLCEAFDTAVSSHLFTEMSLPLLACLKNATFLEHMPWFEPLYGATLTLDADGRVAVPTAPGWGVSFDPMAVARLAAS